MNKIDQKIVGYKVLTDNDQVQHVIQEMHEGVERPDTLSGTTYKIKPQNLDHAVYITINDMVLNNEAHPFEIFINSKNMESFQWVLAITRLISAIWRKGGNTAFLIDELKAVCDPNGGYWSKINGKGVFMKSVVSEIGFVIEKHLNRQTEIVIADNSNAEDVQWVVFPEHATLCPKCSIKAVVSADGCATCLNCGDSKCG